MTFFKLKVKKAHLLIKIILVHHYRDIQKKNKHHKMKFFL